MTDISYIIASRNEYPWLIWTIMSAINDMPEGEEFEVVVVANANDEKNTAFLEHLSKCTISATSRRGGPLRVVWHDKPGFWRALQRGHEEAEGEILVWSCGHVSFQRGCIPQLVDLARQEKGLIHSPMLYLGDYNASSPNWKLYGYKHPITRGWSFNRFRETPYTVCGSGGGVTCARKKEIVDLGWAVEKHMDIVGGGEEYMDLKWWLLGSKVWVHPGTLYHHWAYKGGRPWMVDELSQQFLKDGYGWNNYIERNQQIFLYTLGGEEWVERVKGERMRKYPLWREYFEEIKEECQDTREYILKHQVYDGLTGLFEASPWDFPEKGKWEIGF